MTKEEILKSYNITPETRHHVYDKYLYPKIIKAMEEYGNLMYNQAIDDAAYNAEVEYFIERYNEGETCCHSINQDSILKLKKK